MEQAGLSKNKVISELTRSPHGDLAAYLKVGRAALKEDPEFFGRLLAWNQKRGQMRDAKVALPVIALSHGDDAELLDNAFAHIALQSPRDLVRALRFALTAKTNGQTRGLKRLVERYLRLREESPKWFERTAVQHRRALKELYALCHIKPGAYAKSVLFEGKKVGIFKDIADLPNMTAGEAARTIVNKRIPFLVAVNALGKNAKAPELLLALLEQMTPAEVVTNAKMLERLGVRHDGASRAAFDAKLAEAATSKNVSTFKTAKAAEAVKDKGLSQKLHGVQEKQIAALGGVDGNWLVLADKSPSMTDAIEGARLVSAALAKVVKGKVHLVFFDGTVGRYVDATGKDYDALKDETKRVTAGGSGTSIGSGLAYALDKGFDIDGIAVVSDGAENTAPMFADAYERLCEALGKELPVYLYWMKCHQPNRYGNWPEAMAEGMARAGHDMQVFDLREGTDFYALPNIVQTMRTSRFSLVDEVMATPLLKLDEVLTHKKEK